ncbi:uncharacterized protein BDW70DRAFT_140877 [Aspergillus foveolatus]|uniref:uncharacterized protein n=1 Tax=Aspergillus foveolatus TaxID=210207 RepID=UPI003CCD9482
MTSRPRCTHADYKVDWICALSFEMAAVSLMLDAIHEDLPVSPTDPNTYILGNIGITISLLPFYHRVYMV